MAGRRIIGWKLDRAERADLLAALPPAYPDVIADHVTLKVGAHDREPLPEATTGQVVGVADDSLGVQALVVSIGGSTARPGGGTYHVTWSIDRKRGRRPVDSNRVIAERGWTPLSEPRSIALLPATISPPQGARSGRARSGPRPLGRGRGRCAS